MSLLDYFKREDNKEIRLKLDSPVTTNLIRETSGNTTISVTEDTAMKIAALNQGICIIADTIASMPVYLYKEENGFQQHVANDNRSKALSGMANEVLTSFNLKRNLIKDLILYGNAYAKIIREKDDKIKLVYLPTSIVTPKRDNTGYFFSIQSYSTDVMGEMIPAEIVDYSDMLVFIRNPKYNSISGVGILEHASQVLETSIRETNYMSNLFKNGLSAKAVLSSKTPFKKEIKEQLKSDLKEFYSGVDNAGKMMVLEGDISVLPLSLTPADIKLIENNHFTISQIARFLNIQKHLLNLDRGQGTYSNITQERLMLLQNTLTPYTVILEEAFNQKLLTEEEIENGSYYFAFDTGEMLKLTPEDQAEYMINLYKNNIVTLEEVRARLMLGGDEEIINALSKVQDLKEAKVQEELENATKSDASSIPEENNENESGNTSDKETPVKEVKK
jgi:HK97 family phage portal protein